MFCINWAKGFCLYTMQQRPVLKSFLSSNMSSSKLARVSKQHEKTWCDLHRRLISVPFSFEDVFTEPVYEFIKNKAIALSTSIGYMVPCLLTTTAFVTGLNGTTVSSSTDHRTTLNLYSVVVGPPTTGKSQAMKECAMDPLIAVRDNNDLGDFVLERCTTSALVKCVSDQKRGVVVSPEVYDVLNRMLKNEEENGSGEVQMLCELFSGERTSYKYATEKTRNIGENVPFAIIGCTQVPFAARLICRMDQGHGLLDRFLFWFPMCLRPSPHETEAAKGVLNRIPVKSFTDVFLEMYSLHLGKKEYSFTQAARKVIQSIETEFITELNEAITEGIPSPKSKRTDLVKRLAVSLHVFTHIISDLVEGRKPRSPSKEVTLDTVKKSLLVLDYCESQKQIVIEVIKMNYILSAMNKYTYTIIIVCILISVLLY